MSVLSVSNLEKSFDGNKVLNGVSLELISNKVNLLMGSNGSGKTTLINVISGLISGDKGQIIFKDRDISKKRPDEIFQNGIIRTFQTPKLFSNLSVFENLLMANRAIGESFRHSMFPWKWNADEVSLDEKVNGILESLNLTHLKNSLAYDLSGGQIKLLELGKALMSDSSLVLLDEPIAGINPVLAHTIFSKINQICKDQNKTFLIIEHRLDIALKYVDYAFVMDDGKIIAHDTPDKILDNKNVISSYLGK